MKDEQEELKKEEKRQEKEKNDELNLLDMKKGSIKTYHSLLEDLLVKRMNMVDWPRGWYCSVGHTKKGVVMEVRDPDGTNYRNAFAPVVDPVYDLNAIDTYALRAENLIDHYNDESTKETAAN
jgi:hypothetical protein